jgi:catechol 2,3-dioxygenase-like lactoylglutathione lyase family enzyme
MIYSDKAFSGFSVDNIEKAKDFYADTLGLEVIQTEMGLKLNIGNGIFIYQKDDHQPATYTVLNFPTDNTDLAVEELNSKGITFEHYPEMTDEKGIARGLEYNRGPNIAWFKDPAGNVLSILQDA